MLKTRTNIYKLNCSFICRRLHVASHRVLATLLSRECRSSCVHYGEVKKKEEKKIAGNVFSSSFSTPWCAFTMFTAYTFFFVRFFRCIFFSLLVSSFESRASIVSCSVNVMRWHHCKQSHARRTAIGCLSFSQHKIQKPFHDVPFQWCCNIYEYIDKVASAAAVAAAAAASQRYRRFNYLLSILWIRFTHFIRKLFMHSACGRSVSRRCHPKRAAWMGTGARDARPSWEVWLECAWRRRRQRWWWEFSVFGQKQCTVIKFDLLAIREEI